MTKTSRTHLEKKIIGYMMYGVAVIMPLSNFPQIQQLFTTHVTTGLSLATWILYLLFGLIPLSYAVVNKIRPLVISNVLWVVVDLIMIYGIIVYGSNLGSASYEQLLLINNVGKTISGIGLICVSSAFALFAYDLLELKKKKHA